MTTARSLGLSEPTSFAGQRPAVRELDLDVVRAVDDVIVGEDVSVIADDDPGARDRAVWEPAAAAAPGRGSPAVTGRRRNGGRDRRPASSPNWVGDTLRLALDPNRDDRRGDDLDDVGVRLATARNGVSDGRSGHGLGRARLSWLARRPRRYATRPRPAARPPQARRGRSAGRGGLAKCVRSWLCFPFWKPSRLMHAEPRSATTH